MTVDQTALLNAAKQGNAKAISTLLGRSLHTQGITVKAFVKEKCLSILLESEQTPNQQSLVTFIHKGLTSSGIPTIQSVKVIGKSKGADLPAWCQEFPLESYTEAPITEVEIVKPSTSISQSAIQPIKQIQKTTPTPARAISFVQSKSTDKLPTKFIIIGSGVALSLLCIVGGTATWVRTAQSNAIAKAAELTKNIQADPNSLDIRVIQSNHQNLEQAIDTLQNVPKFFLFNVGEWKTELAENQRQLETTEQNVQAYQTLLPIAQEVVDQFSAMDSGLDVGMNYRDYGAEVRNLKISLDRLGRQPGAANLLLYKELEAAFQEYNFAKDVWQAYIDNDDASHNFLPVHLSVSGTLINQYNVSATSIGSRRYIYLDTALSTVWQEGHKHVEAAQEQIATSLTALSNQR